MYHKRSHPTDGLDKEWKKLVPMAENDTEARVKKLIFLQYRGIETERLAEKLIDIMYYQTGVYLKENENDDPYIETQD